MGATEQLWPFALAAIPLALVVGMICRCLPGRPAARHTLWLTMLLLLGGLPFLPVAPTPDLVATPAPEIVATHTSATTEPARDATDAPDIATTPVPSDLPPKTPHNAVAPMPHPDRPAPVSAVGPTRPDTGSGIASPAPTWSIETAREIRAPIDHLDHFPPAARPNTAAGVPEPVADDPPEWCTDHEPTLSATAPCAPPAPTRRLSHPGPVPNRPRPPSPRRPIIRPTRRPSPHPPIPRSSPPGAPTSSACAMICFATPPLPASIWFGGALLIAIIAIVRIIRMRTLFRHAAPAPADVVRIVAAASRELDLPRMPRVHMVDARISPMVWCAGPTRRLLPRQLWDQLDDVGRSAVVFHELAHLRRRDHWVCWLAMIVGVVYWWHPVVWWIRRRLREEADLCCDAWVTTLLPTSRRAYATALLETKRFTSISDSRGPVIALGVSSTRAKRFARRLTMVMSHHVRPRTTVTGALLACTLAAFGWLVAPTLACPPDKKEPKSPKAPSVRIETHVAPRAPRPPQPPAPQTAPEPDESTFERFLRQREAGGDIDDLSLERRLEHLEQYLARLSKQIEHLAGNFEVDIPNIEEHMNPEDIRRLVEEATQNAYGYAQDFLYQNAPKARQMQPPAPTSATFQRTYKLPAGKLKSIITLMSRDDVPILIAPAEDGITVYGTAEQHTVFKAFCLMIDGEKQRKRYEVPAGRLEALTELMIRSDVPILVTPKKDAIEVQGSDLEQAVFEGFVNLITGNTNASTPARAPEPPATSRRTYDNVRQQYERGAQKRIEETEHLRSALNEIRREHRAHAHRAGELQRRAEDAFNQAKRFEAQADELTDRAGDAGGQRQAEIRARAEEILHRAHELAVQGTKMTSEAEHVRQIADRLAVKSEEVQERIADIRRALADVKEELHEEHEAHEDHDHQERHDHAEPHDHDGQHEHPAR